MVVAEYFLFEVVKMDEKELTSNACNRCMLKYLKGEKSG